MLLAIDQRPHPVLCDRGLCNKACASLKPERERERDRQTDRQTDRASSEELSNVLGLFVYKETSSQNFKHTGR